MGGYTGFWFHHWLKKAKHGDGSPRFSDRPDAMDDTVATDEDQSVVIDALSNDVFLPLSYRKKRKKKDDDDPAELQIVLVTDGANGTTSLNADGTITYTPAADFFGSDSFTYTIWNGETETDIRQASKVDKGGKILSLSLEYTPGDGIAQATAQKSKKARVDGTADDDPGAYVIVARKGKPDKLKDKYILFEGAVNTGDTIVAASLDGKALKSKTYVFVYESEAAFKAGDDPLQTIRFDTSGKQPLEIGDRFGSVTISGATLEKGRALGVDGFDTAVVDVEVAPVNDAPDAEDDAYQTPANTALVIDVAQGVLANDTDPEDDALIASLGTFAENGTVSLLADGSFSYTPDGGFVGTDSFSYLAVDEAGETDTATVTVEVEQVERIYSIEWNATDVVEGDSGETNVSFTVSRDRAGDTTTVEWGFSGTALEGSDFEAPDTHTFGFGETSVTINARILGDTELEPDETIGLAFTRVNDGGTFDPQPDVLTVLNDDLPAREYSVSWEVDQVNEGDSGITEVLYTVSRDRAGETTSVNWAFSGTAAEGEDYNALGSASNTFGFNETSITRRIEIFGDTAVELNETLGIAITNADDGGTFSMQPVELTIVNDDVPPPVYSVTWDTDAVDEGTGGDTPVTFTVTRDKALATALVQVAFSGSADSSDFTFNNLLFGMGSQFTTSVTKTVLISGDSTFEPDETLGIAIVDVQSSAGADFVSTPDLLTIRDDDPQRNYAISWDVDTFAEGDSGPTVAFFTITRDVAGATTTVDLSFGGSAEFGTDFTAFTERTFGISDLSVRGSIAIEGDTDRELDETVDLAIASVSDGGSFSTATDTLTITDDDRPVYTVAWDTPSVTEGDTGDQTIGFTVSRDIRGDTVTIELAFSGSATEGEDYTPSRSSIFFDATGLSRSGSITLPGDTTFEPDETVVLSLVERSANDTLIRVSTDPTTLTIVNDDRDLLNPVVPEHTTFVGETSLVPGIDPTSTLSLGGADAALFEILSDGKLRFREMPSFELALDENGDNVYDLNLIETLAGGGTEVQAISVSVSDQPEPSRDSINGRYFDDQNANGVDDSEPGVAGKLVELLDDQGTVLASDTTDVDGFYFLPKPDVGAIPRFSVRFEEPGTGFAFTEQNVGSNPSIDSDVDPTTGETFPVLFPSAPLPATFQLDAGQRAANFDIAWEIDTVTEGDTTDTVVNYTVTRQNTQATATVEVAFSGTAIEGGDFTVSARPTGFGPGVASRSGSVTISGDTVVEGDETIGVQISSAANVNDASFNPIIRTLTVLNDDTDRLYSIAWSVDEVVEGDSGQTPVTYTITRDRAQVTATIDVAFTGTAEDGVDYNQGFTTSMGFPTLSVTRTVFIEGDTAFEPDETIEIAISNVTSTAPAVIDPASSILTIVDDDAVFGTDQNDDLVGTDNPEVLFGLAGDDSLTGLGGADVFAFTLLGENDTVTDFARGSDKIGLDPAVFTSLAGGVTAANVVTGPPADADDYLSLVGNTLFYDTDGNGGASAGQQVAVLQGIVTIDETDFTLL